MIEGIGIEELKRRIRIDHPKWADAGVHQEAMRLLKTLDPRVEGALEAYVRNGMRMDFCGNGVAVSRVMGRFGYDYLRALEVASLALKGRSLAMAAVRGFWA